jgi:hypothetical protein
MFRSRLHHTQSNSLWAHTFAVEMILPGLMTVLTQKQLTIPAPHLIADLASGISAAVYTHHCVTFLTAARHLLDMKDTLAWPCSG